jgi:hypothetical protein
MRQQLFSAGGAVASESAGTRSSRASRAGAAPGRAFRRGSAVKVAAIVEGDGEVAAVPVLLRRLGAWRTPTVFTEVLLPIRVRRDRFLNRERRNSGATCCSPPPSAARKAGFLFFSMPMTTVPPKRDTRSWSGRRLVSPIAEHRSRWPAGNMKRGSSRPPPRCTVSGASRSTPWTLSMPKRSGMPRVGSKRAWPVAFMAKGSINPPYRHG